MAISLVDALRRPRLEGLLPEERHVAARAALHAHEDEGGESPAVIRALVGFGAWLAAILLLVLLIILNIAQGPTAVVFGLAAMGGAAALRRGAGPGSVFRTQFALSASLAGHGLFIGYIAIEGGPLAGALAAAAVGIAGLFVMPDPVHRFASTLVAVGGLVFGIWDLTESQAVVGISLALVAPAWVVVFWFEDRLQASRWADLQLPVGFGLSAIVAALSVPALMPGVDSAAPVAGVAMTAALAWLAVNMARARGADLRTGSAVAMGGLLVAFTWIGLSAPGVVAAAIGMTLGVERRHPVLSGAAVLFFVGFVAAWYSQMDLTLFAKAGALAGGGGLFLLVRLALRRPGGAP